MHASLLSSEKSIRYSLFLFNEFVIFIFAYLYIMLPQMIITLCLGMGRSRKDRSLLKEMISVLSLSLVGQ